MFFITFKPILNNDFSSSEQSPKSNEQVDLDSFSLNIIELIFAHTINKSNYHSENPKHFADFFQ